MGKGVATYIGCRVSSALTEKILKGALVGAGLWGADQQFYIPIITKTGVNEAGTRIRYFFNYSDKVVTVAYPYSGGKDLLMGGEVLKGDMVMEAWGVRVVEVE